MGQVTENWEAGVNISGRKINDLRYADNTVIIVADEKELAILLNRIEHLY